MGRNDTGLSNNPPNNAEVSPNRELEQPRAGEDSDSDLEDEQWGGYMPLSQNPNDGEPLYNLNDAESDDEINVETEAACATNVPEVKPSSSALVEEVWSKPAPKEVDIEMNDKKISLVKQVMSNIQLPSEAIPAWAKDIPEDAWKEHLLQRLIKDHQSGD